MTPKCHFTEVFCLKIRLRKMTMMISRQAERRPLYLTSRREHFPSVGDLMIKRLRLRPRNVVDRESMLVTEKEMELTRYVACFLSSFLILD